MQHRFAGEWERQDDPNFTISGKKVQETGDLAKLDQAGDTPKLCTACSHVYLHVAGFLIITRIVISNFDAS